jgi:aminoglycoside phosphotransferase (APT) family kinase protein
LGAPLSDLAYNCLFFHVADPTRGDITNLDYASYGIPSEQACVARYCAQTGRKDIPHWNFYVVLSLFRLAAISQGVYKRGLEGNAASPEALTRRDRCRALATAGWELVEKGI